MSDARTIQEIKRLFMRRDENAATELKGRYWDGGVPPIEERLVFVEGRLRDACNVILWLCDAVDPPTKEKSDE